jgi:hypothetical protein
VLQGHGAGGGDELEGGGEVGAGDLAAGAVGEHAAAIDAVGEAGAVVLGGRPRRRRLRSRRRHPPDRLAGRSLRAGHATTAAQNRAPDRTIIRKTSHRRLETLDGYMRPATVFIDNSARFLGLDDQPPP